MNWFKKIFGFNKESSKVVQKNLNTKQIQQKQSINIVSVDDEEPSTDLPPDFNPPKELIGLLSKTILEFIKTKDTDNAIKILRAIRKAKENNIYDNGKFPSKDEITEALPFVKWATETLPNNPIAWMARCVVLDIAVFVFFDIEGYDYKSAKEEVIKVFTETAKKASKYPEAFIPKGFLYKGFASSPHNLSIAVQTFDAALKLKPGMEDALYGKAQLYDKYQDYRKALLCYKELAKLYPEQPVYERAAKELAELVPSFLQGK